MFLTKGAPGDAMVNVDDAKKCGNNTLAKLMEDSYAIEYILRDAELEDSNMMYNSNGK